ncbi:metalloprotease family protein [Chitinophaga sp. 30R24]|uniref:metalloprotease family protein n=1 Tax=Chitinophaga sp. 30R24 TaxID=3248838 RepID=UPI003B902844
MFFIPGLGLVISVLTFPGVIVHEFAHQLFCRLYGIAIFEVKYFQVGNPLGYVIHEIPRNPAQQLMISIGPFFVNTLLGLIIAFPAAIPVLQFNAGTPFDYILLYLGISIAMHAFPSLGDAQSMWYTLWHDENSTWWLKALSVPVAGLIMLGTIGSIFWLDLGYGILICTILPKYIISLFA